jgi:hypothetical protein
MKRTRIRAGIAIAAVGCFVITLSALLQPQPPVSIPQALHFAGLTNGIVGPLTPVYASLSTNTSTKVQQWLAAGSTGAIFSVTNEQTCAIWFFPVGTMSVENEGSVNEPTWLLNASTFSGIKLEPGQATNIQVAANSNGKPWRLMLNYHRDSCSDSFINRLKLVPASLRARASGQPIQMQMYTIESGVIAQ